MLYHRQPDGSLALVRTRKRGGVVLQPRRYQGMPSDVRFGADADPRDETAVFKALHAAAVAKYQATHGPKPNPLAAAVAQQAMDSLSAAYLALGRTRDELAAATSLSWWERFLKPIGDTARETTMAVAVVAGVGVLGYVIITRPARRMDY